MKFSTLNNLTYSELNQKTYGDLEKDEILEKPIEISLAESLLELKTEDVNLIPRIILTSNKFKPSPCYFKRDRLSCVRRIGQLSYTARKMTIIAKMVIIGLRFNLQFEETKLRINNSTIKLNEVSVLKFKDALLELKKLKNISYEIKNILDVEAYKLDFKYNYMVLNGYLKPVSFINAVVIFDKLELTNDKKGPIINSTVYMAPESF